MVIDRQRLQPPKINTTLRLIKGIWDKPLPKNSELKLCTPDGVELETEPVHPENRYPWAFGFWVPEKLLLNEIPLTLKLNSPKRQVNLKVVYEKPASGALPLRYVDDLYSYIENREIKCVGWPGVDESFKVANYLKKHDIIYEKPASHWTEGLYLGNGILGGIVTGDPAGEFNIGLDHADIWFATEKEHPLGRGYASDIKVKYRVGKNHFNQRLSLGNASVITDHDDLQILTYVDKNLPVAVLELKSSSSKEVSLNLERRVLPLIKDNYASLWNDSWVRVVTEDDLKQYQTALSKSSYAKIFTRKNSLICAAPNISVISTMYSDANIQTQMNSDSMTMDFVCNKKPVNIFVAVSLSEPGMEEDAIKTNNKNIKKVLSSGYSAHQKSWEDFWQRSFIQMEEDTIKENLYYQGIYHMACSFSGNTSVSFFGLTQPIDHRTWNDGHTSDAQTEMLTWGSYTSNHLALTAPLLHFYARCWQESAEHTPFPGGKVPHCFASLEGGGHALLAITKGKETYPFGSTAWHVLDFWWDFLYSGDKTYLRKIAYPIMRSAAEAIIKTMEYENGTYHCRNSASPEQNNAGTDNIYDRVCVEALLLAVIKASEILRTDTKERVVMQKVLNNLFPTPNDGKTIVETLDNHHPYRCHPVVLMGLYPFNLWNEKSQEYEMAQKTFDIVTNLFGFHYEDRHGTIIGHEGGIEPNGHATSFLLAFAARLKRPDDFDKIFKSCVLGRQLKRNGLRSICDPRHSKELETMAIIEASSGQSAAILECYLQSTPGCINVFPCINTSKPVRFTGLRAMGGFIVSAEWTGSEIKFIAIKSIFSGKVTVTAPWDGQKPIWIKQRSHISPLKSNIVLKKNETVFLGQNKTDLKTQKWKIRSVPAKAPICIPVSSTDTCTPDILYYPEDLPHGQDELNGCLFIGNPVSTPAPDKPAWNQKTAVRNATSPDYRLRQTSARILGRFSNAESRKILKKLCRDEHVIVAATALVSLVRHNTGVSDKLLKEILKTIDRDYLKREVTKALNRRKILEKFK